MKILVAYYSRTGTTKKVAEEISKTLKADLDEIVDKKNRTGALGYVIAGKDASLKKLTEINFKKDPKNYDLVILGTPTWAWKMTPALRTYLNQNNSKLKNLAYFVTMGGSGGDSVIKEIEKIVNKSGEKLILTTKEVISNNYKDKVKSFCKNILKK